MSVRSKALRACLRIDNRLRRVITRLAVAENGGSHPKHYIIAYERWFCERLPAGGTVVDIGANTGRMARAMAAQTGRVIGIEIDRSLVDTAMAAPGPGNVEFIHADATTFDYRRLGRVDCVTMSNVLEHIEDRIGLLKSVIASISWPATGPLVLVRVPMVDRDWLVEYKRSAGIEWRCDETHFTEYTERSFIEEMSAAGLRVTDIGIRYGELYAVCAAGTVG